MSQIRTPQQRQAAQRGTFPLPWPDCDVHRAIVLGGPIHTTNIAKRTRLPLKTVHNICNRLGRYGLVTSRRVSLESAAYDAGRRQPGANRFSVNIVWQELPR